MNIHKIEARDLPDLWFQAINDVQDIGRRFKIDHGSYAGQTRLEYDYFIGHVKNPGYGHGMNEILPQIPEHLGIPNPVEFEYVYGGGEYSRSYVEYVMTPTKEENESYTYGERLTRYRISNSILAEYYNTQLDSNIIINDREILDQDVVFFVGKPSKYIFVYDNELHVNQIELAIWTYKNKGPRNNQIVLQVARPCDMLLQDPPCLRHIDTRIQDGRLSFVVYFRSWDLWAGLPANLAGIEFLQKYMADEIGVEQGDMVVESKVVESKGLHLYGYAEELAKLRTGKE
jgi:thymidylate synthase